jgi:hypothetical protein
MKFKIKKNEHSHTGIFIMNINDNFVTKPENEIIHELVRK